MKEQKKSIGYKFDLSVWSILSVLWLFLLISFDPKFHLLSFIIYVIIFLFIIFNTNVHSFFITKSISLEFD